MVNRSVFQNINIMKYVMKSNIGQDYQILVSFKLRFLLLHQCTPNFADILP